MTDYLPQVEHEPCGSQRVRARTLPPGEKQSRWLLWPCKVQLRAPRICRTVQSRSQSWATKCEAKHEFCHPSRVFGFLLSPSSEARGFQVQGFAIKLLV